MLATAGPVPAGAERAFEINFDGVRAVGFATRSGLRLVSRNDRDAGLELGAGLVVDGELVALDERGRPDFPLLQQRMHLTHPTPALVRRCRCRTIRQSGV